MANGSTIEWTDSTWNPTTGCTKISAGCRNCYAERMARRLQAMGQANYAGGFDLAIHENTLGLPLTWRKPRMIFVNSMSDLFHEGIPDEFIKKVFDVMRTAHWHRFQVLTKRAGNLTRLDHIMDWPDNVWMGVSVENARCKARIDALRATGARIKFLSLEPLLGPLGRLDLEGIDWVIVGGESGPGARPMREEWVVEIQEQCASAEVPFFFKQWGGVRKKQNGRSLLGRTWDEVPSASFSLARAARGSREDVWISPGSEVITSHC
jgi:protein gp37